MSDPSTTPPAEAPAASTEPAVDIESAKQAAAQQATSDLLAKFKEATGFDSLDAFKEAELKKQGKLQELADNKAGEAQAYKAKFEQAAINNALLTAASEAVDPSVVTALLSGQCACDDKGVVTIGGKPVGDAVKSLLADKPFLAKAQGGTGSGAPQRAGPGKSLTRGEFAGLAPAAQMQFVRNGGKITE